MRRNFSAYLPLFLISIVVVIAIFADQMAPYDPALASVPDRLHPPFWQLGGSMEYPLGTDSLGRDILSRIIYGARISLLVGVAAVLSGGAVGTALGVASGYIGGILDAVVMRAADATLSLPVILVAILFAVSLGPGLTTVIIAITIVLWAQFARVIRGEVLKIKGRDFVALARIAGASHIRIMAQHIFPNLLSTLLVLLSLYVGWAILVEAALSFLGAGIPPPTPSWGGMVAEGRDYVTSAWWIAVFPGAVLTLVAVSLNLIGDWLRDTLDPSLRGL